MINNYCIAIIAIIIIAVSVSQFYFHQYLYCLSFLLYIYYTGAPIENASKPEVICARYDIINEGNKFVLMN